ncbi:PREDICTED: transmembrane protein 72 [Nanorana parkeri]|uniref:transmembrane protein 72 n=1 Tax=Nanorana parkeri TaxID=125878 RepID=UPI000854A1E7|nr:PREDICTED: transmembrane protein 72 [Nanorana parkeri]
MQCQASWVVLEGICRFLGVCTAAVLIGVGIETLQKGQFPSLAYYLLFSSAAVSFCEGVFFIHMFLMHCIRWQSEPRLYVCLRKTARMGGFQKFLGYGILSVACFLHPVLVWHVTIPGTMLIVTGIAYLFLSKRKKTKSKDCVLQAEYYTDPSTTAIAMTRAGDTEQTYTFNDSLRQKRESLLTHMRSILKVKKDRQPSKKDQGRMDASIDLCAKKKQVHFEEKVIKIIPLEEGILEDQDSELEVTISDTIPIIPSEPKQVLNTTPMTSGIF